MRSKLLSMVIGAAAISAAVLVSQVPGVAQAAPLAPLAPAAGTAIPTATGGSNTLFGLTLPVNANCPDTGTVGYRLHGFIAPISVDVASLTWTGLGAPVGNALAKNLYDQGGSGVRNLFPVGAPVVGAISGIPGDIQLSAGGVFGPGSYAPGVYQIGVACAFADAGGVNRTEKFYASRITISTNTAVSGGGAQVNYAIGEAPAAPVLATPSSTGPTTATIGFTQAVATPAVTGYTATVTPAAGVTIAPLTAASTSIQLSGLTIGTTYTVTLSSTNGSTSSLATRTFTASNPTPPAPVATATSSAGKATINWTAPASGPTPIGYSVIITGTSPVVAPQTITLGNVLTTGDVTLPVGSYSATVTATYAASEFITPVASNVVTFGSMPSTLIEQEITVTRPQLNALILTQRCGVNGALLPEAATPRFPRALALLAASADQIGTVPTPDTQANFDQYPLPATPVYPTRCGLTLTNVQLITSGALRGQYFTASGALNQVTVADFRDADTGWTLTGTMANFTDGGSRSFSGNFLGWTPAAPIVSAPTATGYTQTVTAGAVVQPGDGVGTFGGTGLGSGRTLATTPTPTATTGGTGIADLNARVKLLIPTTAKAATYKGLLTFTVA